MQPMLAYPVVYSVHEGHKTLFTEHVVAGIIGAVNEDGTFDLIVFHPNREPRWVENVPQGTGPHTFRLPGPVAEPAPAPEPKEENPTGLPQS